jgi:hypothetical protein
VIVGSTEKARFATCAAAVDFGSHLQINFSEPSSKTQEKFVPIRAVLRRESSKKGQGDGLHYAIC